MSFGLFLKAMQRETTINFTLDLHCSHFFDFNSSERVESHWYKVIHLQSEIFLDKAQKMIVCSLTVIQKKTATKNTQNDLSEAQSCS